MHDARATKTCPMLSLSREVAKPQLLTEGEKSDVLQNLRFFSPSVTSRQVSAPPSVGCADISLRRRESSPREKPFSCARSVPPQERGFLLPRVGSFHTRGFSRQLGRLLFCTFCLKKIFQKFLHEFFLNLWYDVCVVKLPRE